MSRPLSATLETATLAAVVYPVFLVDLETAAGTTYVWNGVGNLTWGGNTYTGVGDLGSISAIEETAELKASGIVLSLSGIPSTMLSLTLASMRAGLTASVYFAAFTSGNVLIANPILVFEGLTDVPTIEDGGDTAKISITVESLEVDWARQRVRRYTPEDQKLIDPVDRGFEYIAKLQDAKFQWGG